MRKVNGPSWIIWCSEDYMSGSRQTAYRVISCTEQDP